MNTEVNTLKEQQAGIDNQIIELISKILQRHPVSATDEEQKELISLHEYQKDILARIHAAELRMLPMTITQLAQWVYRASRLYRSGNLGYQSPGERIEACLQETRQHFQPTPLQQMMAEILLDGYCEEFENLIKESLQ